MPADLILTNDGIKYAGGNIIDLKAAMPTTGSYVAGDIVLESTTGQRISGWKRLTTGSNHVLGTDWAYVSASPQLGTAVATTSGTAIDFTGIPSWVKRITVLLNGVSTTGTSNIIIQLGTAGSFETTGYDGGSWQANVTVTAYSSGFMLGNSNVAAANVKETLVLNLIDPTTNTFVGFGTGAVNSAGGGNAHIQGGSKSLSGTLTRIRLTTVGGTDTFDAGSVNILVE